jgi:hypothetical protein
MDATEPSDRPSLVARRSSSSTSPLVNGRGSVSTPTCRSQEKAQTTSPVSDVVMTPLVVGSDAHGL